MKKIIDQFELNIGKIDINKINEDVKVYIYAHPPGYDYPNKKFFGHAVSIHIQYKKFNDSKVAKEILFLLEEKLHKNKIINKNDIIKCKYIEIGSKNKLSKILEFLMFDNEVINGFIENLNCTIHDYNKLKKESKVLKEEMVKILAKL